MYLTLIINLVLYVDEASLTLSHIIYQRKLGQSSTNLRQCQR